MFWGREITLLSVLPLISGLQWHPDHVGYNLNENKTATRPADYWGEWENHSYHPSPENWRFPFYTITLDRYLDGDPTNNEVNGSVFEHHWLTTQFRFGGDTIGLMNELDYLQGLGIKALYLAGTPFLNRPWSADGFGPLDFTLLDRHHGDIEDWRNLVTEIHRRDMYVIIDNVMATMGDLIGFEGSLNATAPFKFQEYDYVWKTETQYHDFRPGNERNESCEYPRMWAQDGFPISQDIRDQMDYHGCRDSEFDQYGDIKGTGAYPSHINSLSKFAAVQDRLREWRPDVLEKIKRMSCIQIAMFDFDGFRMDKGIQTTIDALAEFAEHQRECARRRGKDNFLVVGEIVADPNLASIYVGRGKQPDQALGVPEDALTVNNETDPDNFIRPTGMNGLDGSAFHYDIYGALTRFLGLDGPWGARGVDWVEQWNFILQHNDMVNANSGELDPRHMFGMTNQDVFRWPALADGYKRQYLGYFITMLELPGIPIMLWGEEQEFYVHENLVDDYLFGRQPMASSSAWQLHGCYDLGQDVFIDAPFDSTRFGCYDDKVSLDHRDPAKPMRNVLKRMFELRRTYPVLNDGFNLTTLSTKTYDIYLPGSKGVPSPHGIWSVYRGRSELVQDFAGTGQGNQGIWLIYSNENRSTSFEFDCASPNTSLALISAFPAGTKVKNLFHPYEELLLESSEVKYGIEDSTEFNGCLPQLEMPAWGYKAFVPRSEWVKPAPTMTKTTPSHDERLRSTVDYDEDESIPLEIGFSSEMDCDTIADVLEIDSTTQRGNPPRLNTSSIKCSLADGGPPRCDGEVPTAWVFSATLSGVENGVHTVTIRNASTVDGDHTNTVDRFMFRVGQMDNPMVFPQFANYSKSLLHQDHDTGSLYISPRAAGADKIRYSRTWGSSFSKWLSYTGENITLEKQSWSGTEQQEWEGEHVIVHYWSGKTASSDHVQHSDLERNALPPRRVPHFFVLGDFNRYGSDVGIPSNMELHSDGLWKYDLIADLPSLLTFNVWGVNADGMADQSQSLGDVNGDKVLDWVPPEHLAKNFVNVSVPPPKGYLGYQLVVNDGTYGYSLSPVGSFTIQAVMSVLLCVVPVITSVFGILMFVRLFCQVKFNRIGLSEKGGLATFLTPSSSEKTGKVRSTITSLVSSPKHNLSTASISPVSGAAVVDAPTERRTVLIATLEYEIEDWELRIKIGGLGVMTSLMGKHLGHHNLIWVVPCVGVLEYPEDCIGYPMTVTVLGQQYEVAVRYHTLRNITFVLLDAPIFRKQSNTDPYPARMDDLESAMFYSAWNQCIAQAIYRFDPDIYHINDFHGCLAPLYLLPRVTPSCLSLHNAEFQGSWSLNTPKDMDEVSRVFNLGKEVVERYVQFGGVFNLLHAGATYLRNHQKGFGAVGVSDKYGRRSKQRYPIFWGLRKVGSLPNPDPADLGAKNAPMHSIEAPILDDSDGRKRATFRCQVQEWAGLTVDATAELFVFVGRWSMQKGIDIIADVFFSVLLDHPKAQLICVGPVIDLYGKFAALKLSKLAARFPGRVLSKPEFTILPPYLFSGAEFALIPSRDEPFGLVAVEFGRKGSLGVGSKVGGLGQMPGWWYTVESLTSKHLMEQLKQAVRSALVSDQKTRTEMRAKALVQRFPVQQWVEDVDKLHSTAIHISHEQQQQASINRNIFKSFTPSGSGRSTPAPPSRAPSPILDRSAPPRRPLTIPHPPTEAMPRTGSYRSFQGQLHSLAHGLEGEQTTAAQAQHTDPRDGASSLPDPAGNPRRDLMTAEDGQESGYTSVHESRITSPWTSPPSSPRLTPRSSSWHMRIFGRAGTALPDPTLSQTDWSAYESGANAGRSSRDPFSYEAAVQQRKDFGLQKVDVIFTDSQNEFYQRFSERLEKLDAKSSEDQLCIERFLVRSEKAWFARFDRAKLGLDPLNALPTTIPGFCRWFKARWQDVMKRMRSSDGPEDSAGSSPRSSIREDEFLLGNQYTPPSGMKKILQKKIGDWQIYCFLLAFGQIIATNSYQITILTGEYGEATHKLYSIASIYVAATVVWWCMYRRLQAVYVVSLPFAVYGLAFLILGMGLYAPNIEARHWIFNVATGLYGAASASGSLFFALNFGTDGGIPAKTWAFRACVIQGTAQIYLAFLWYWGVSLNQNSQDSPQLSSKTVTAITIPIAVLMWTIGVVLYLGLPNYYRRATGSVPAFYLSLVRRKSVIWFLVMVVLQNLFLSTTYNRNWTFLWSSQHMPPAITIALIFLFFVGVWAMVLFILARKSSTHPWLIPIFAISLGAPRWCQTLWSTSGIGLYVPLMPQNPLVGAILSRLVWLWLGVLDAVQGVGFGMILLQTLTRFHVAATLMISQVVGSIVTILAKATAPNRIGPGSVFPNFALVGIKGLERPWFWVGLICQLIICVGFLKVFRKEQLFKP